MKASYGPNLSVTKTVIAARTHDFYVDKKKYKEKFSPKVEC